MPAAVSKLRGTLDVVYREMLKFGAVGAIAFVVDVGLFNLLTTDSGPLDGHEKWAKVISAGTATVVAWVGNRYWSFRHRRQTSRSREFITFGLMNVVATGIAVACLAISHDVLGFTSRLADNISGNVIGIGLGTLFRFWAYRTFVFTQFIDPEGRDRDEDPEAEPLPADAAGAGAGQPQPAVPLDGRRLSGAAATPTAGVRPGAADEQPRRAAG